MKKTAFFLLALIMVSACAFALPGGVLPYGAGAKYAAMGGAGSALVDDIASAYYNPGGMYRSQAVALKIGAGTASQGSDKLMAVFANMSNPAKFLADNYSTDLNIKGNLNAFVGLDIGKIGLSVTPVTYLNLSKPANTLNGSINANLMSDSAMTFGYGISLPYVGKLGVGINAKYIYYAGGGATVGIAGLTTTDITNTVNTYTGMGMDLGLQGSVDVMPMVPVSFAMVLKDFGGVALKGNQTISKATYDNTTGNQVGSSTTISDGPVADYVVPSTLVIGASAKVPVIGTRIAVDIDNVSGGTPAQSYAVTHIGVEYPIAMGLVNLRAGKITGGAGGSIDMFTYGAGILKDMINIAMVSDNKNSSNNQMIADIHLGF